MSNLIELLRKWAELEPERCWPYHSTYYHFKTPAPGDSWLIDAGASDLFIDQAMCCGAIEAAIVERGWEYIQSFTPALGLPFAIRMAFLDRRGETRPAKGEGSTKLEALLSAYTQALEAAK